MGSSRDKYKEIIIWVHDLDRDLLKYLREENVKVVAVIQAASKEGVPSISPFDLFYRTEKIHFNERVSKYIYLSDSFMNRYLDCISRVSFMPTTEAFTYREIGVVSADNVVDWAQFHAQTALHLLQYYKPDEIWITHMPHLGIDNILVEVGRQLGITVLTLHQSIMPGKFFYNIIGDENSQPKLEFMVPKNGTINSNLFYMHQKDSMSVIERLVERVIFYMTAPFKKNRKKAVERLYLALQRRDWALFLLFMDCLCTRTREVAFTRFIRRLKFKSELKKRTYCNNADLERPFIYFALHLQPEQTTSALGGLFANQINAIEAIRDILPSEWQIFIKENPKQRYMYRDMPFFARIRQLPDVKFIDDSFGSQELIRKSHIVATITGSVGYEALVLGKPCVFFGDAWFEGLPNAFRFSEKLNLDEISRQKTDAQELSKAVISMMSKAADGVVFPYYRGLLDKEVDWSSLMKITAKSLVKISNTANPILEKM